jgi:hypothetical protein
MELFTRTRLEGQRFDSDPANFIACDSGGELVLIDPLCQQMELPDFVFVVFMFGLFKASLANPLRARWMRYRELFDRYCRAYCLRNEQADPADIRRQLVAYVDQVIRWNRDISAAESLATKLGRRLLWLPVLRWYQRWLKG